jgi:hypothetical protein
MDSLAQTSSGWAEARATYKRRCGAARGRRRPRERRKVVASSAEEGPAAVAAAEVPRRRTAMPNSPEQVGAGEDAVQSRQEHAASGCGPGGEAEREAYLTAWHGPVYSKLGMRPESDACEQPRRQA